MFEVLERIADVSSCDLQKALRTRIGIFLGERLKSRKAVWNRLCLRWLWSWGGNLICRAPT